MLEVGIVSDEISLNIEEAIEIGLDLGIKKYEIRCIGSYENRIPFIDQRAIDYLQKNIDARKIEITALSPGTFKIKPSEIDKVNEQLEEVLPATCRLAKQFHADKIISFGFVRDNVAEGRIVEILQKAGKIVGNEGLILAIENEPGFYCDTGQNTLGIIEKINMDNVRINWDPGNALGAGEVPFPTGYGFVKPYIVNLHVKDTVNYPKFECRLLNEGGVNWIGQLNAIYQDNLLPFITLETHQVPLIESTREALKRLKLILELIGELNRT